MQSDDIFEAVPNKISTESKISEIIGGDDDGNVDVWASSEINNILDVDQITNAKENYQLLLRSIKNLFNLFEFKEDKNTGVKWTTDKKVFNRIDFKLFKLIFGLEINPETKKPYGQEEIADVLMNYGKSIGFSFRGGNLSQAAVAYRKAQLLSKINLIMSENDSIRLGFEYVYNNFLETNFEGMDIFSNKEEEMNLELNLDTPQKMESIFQINDENEDLDDEIANYMNT